jgi:hypothetical protein
VRENGQFCTEGKRRESKRTLSHLVTTLTASDVDDNVRVGELRDRLGDDRLSATERSRNRSRSSLNTGEERVEDTLTGEERVVGLELLAGGTRGANGPDLEEGVGGFLAFKFGLENDVLQRGKRVSCREEAEEGGGDVRQRCTSPFRRGE